MAFSPQDIYARRLVSRRGYPLWTPEPDRSLPDVYISEGLKIGDVGVVVPRDGSFDVFFNVCLPDDHPLHRETGVPNNFTHIPLSGRDVATFPEAESAGRIISTYSVARVKSEHASEDDVERRVKPGPLNYEFKLSSREGAVLILPEGAERHYLHNEHVLMDEAIRHAVDWYAFAEQRLGRIINHDSLYLITGFHKARSWSLAAYRQGGKVAEASAQFKAVQVGRGDITANYTWETTNAMDWRVGPSNLYYLGTANQSVFIEGFKIAIRETLLLRRKRVNVVAGFPSVRTYHGDFSSSSRGSNSWGGRSTRSDNSTAIARGSADSNTDTAESDPSASRSDDSSEDIVIQQFPQVEKPFHPSDFINQYLLEKVPSAMVAITHDIQWTTLLEKELLDPEELLHEGRLRDVFSSYKVVYKEGAVYLNSEEESPQKDDVSLPSPEGPVDMIDRRTSGPGYQESASGLSNDDARRTKGRWETCLHNHLQGQDRLHRLSWVEVTRGPPNNLRWEAIARLDGVVYGRGIAWNLRDAREVAAETTYRALRDLASLPLEQAPTERPLTANMENLEMKASTTASGLSKDDDPRTKNRWVTCLYDHLQGQDRLHRLSWVEVTHGPPNNLQWEAIARFDGIAYGRGIARSLRDAKEIAAETTYRALTSHRTN